MQSRPDYSSIVQLAEIGQYSQALQELTSAMRFGLKVTADVQALRVDLLEECGRYAEVEAAADAVLRSKETNGAAKSRVLCALARMRHTQGRNEESSRLFTEAQRAAIAIDDQRLICKCQLAALATVADAWPRSSLAAYVRDVRHRVLRLGDRRLTARLHHYIARFEVLAGDIAGARRHLEAGRRLFDPKDDKALDAKYASTEANLCWFAAEYEAGIAACDKAIQQSEANDLTWDLAAARSTRCWLLLHVGKFEDAERELRELLTLDLPVLARLLTLDTYIDLALATGRTEQAEQLLEKMAEALPLDGDENPSFYEVNWRESRLRLLAQRGDWAGAEKVATEAILGGLARRERLASARFRVFRCEALLRQAKVDEAVADAVLAVSESESLTAGHRSHLDRALGLLLEAHGDLQAAERYLARAVRINRTSGNAWANVQTKTDHARVAAAAGPGALANPTDVVATMFQLAPRADLLAHECVELLRANRCADAIAIVSIGPDGDVQVVPSDGIGQLPNAGRDDGNAGTIRIPTGERTGRRFDVLIQPGDDLASRLAVVNTKKIVEAALELERLRQAERERESLWPQEEFADDEAGVFVSAEMIDLLATARRVAPTDIPVLLTGETGTGKEVLARAIHRASARAAKPFLAFNCVSVPRDLIDSQLFGYRRGAFTGARDAFAGVIRGAEGGTLFLDEIGEIPPDVQPPKLLRFLETRDVHPLGETRPVTVDTRIVAATNADLDRLVAAGRFREDLLYRLNVVHFRLPPLRQRREEIPPLVHHFLVRYADELGRGRPRVSEEAMEYLLLYGWPGNVRQLGNEIRRAVALLSQEIRASRRTLPADAGPRDNEIMVAIDRPLDAIVESVERIVVARALEQSRGNISKASKLLGVTRKGLSLKRKRLGLAIAPPA